MLSFNTIRQVVNGAKSACRATAPEAFSKTAAKGEKAAASAFSRTSDSYVRASVRQPNNVKTAQNLRTSISQAEAKAYFETRLQDPRCIFRHPVGRAQMVNFLNANGDNYSLLYKLAKSGKFSLQENPSAFMRVLSSTNQNTSNYLNLILDGTLTLEKVDKSGKIATLTADELASFIQFNRNNKHISELVTSPKKMTEFLERSETLINNAKRIDKRDIFDPLMQNTSYHSKTLYNATLNKNILDDMEALIHGKSYYPKYSSTTASSQILRETKMGDAIAIDGKMYLNNGKSLEKLNFDEKKYTELFPPIRRFNAKQSTEIGDCFMVSPLSAMMNSEKGRCHIYRMFMQDSVGNVWVKSANSAVPVCFDGFEKSVPHITNNKGLAMIEMAYAKGANPELTDFNEIMHWTGGGWTSNSKGLELIFGDSAKTARYTFHASDIDKNLRSDLAKYANRDDFVTTIGVCKINPEYNMMPSHAYTLRGYDAKNKMVTIANPHRAGLDVKIPEEEILPYISRISVSQLA